MYSELYDFLFYFIMSVYFFLFTSHPSLSLSQFPTLSLFLLLSVSLSVSLYIYNKKINAHEKGLPEKLLLQESWY